LLFDAATGTPRTQQALAAGQDRGLPFSLTSLASLASLGGHFLRYDSACTLTYQSPQHIILLVIQDS
jgi:hypothetical protein